MPYLWLECALERMLEGFGDNTLIIGRILAASVDERFLRTPETKDRGPARDAPLLAYLSPGRFASIEQSSPFPFHVDFKPSTSTSSCDRAPRVARGVMRTGSRHAAKGFWHATYGPYLKGPV